jgi:hypothetical protein
MRNTFKSVVPIRLRDGASGLALAAVVLISAGGIAGASHPTSHKSGSSKAILSAYTRTLGGKSADVSITVSVAETGAGQATKQVSASGTGSVDFANGNGELKFSLPTVGTFTERIIGPLLFLQLPASDGAQLPSGKTWAEIDLNTITEAKLGQSYAQLTSSSQESTQTLSYLQGVSSTGVSMVGAAKIRGVATTEYKATVDLTKVADEKSPTEQAAIKSVEAELHTTTLPLQVWLDAQGRVRQIAEQVQASTTPSSVTGSTTTATSDHVTTTVDYYDFGVPVNVTPPPSTQVDDITGQALADSTTTTTTGG